MRRPDIRVGVITDYLVAGYFTDDYRPLAEALSASLVAHGIPHVLYSWGPATSWEDATLAKPEAIEMAMAEHPNATVIFMDVDCIVSGPVKDVIPLITGVGLGLKFKRTRLLRRAGLQPSSRIIVVKPTPGARVLIAQWAHLCRFDRGAKPWSDETLLAKAIGRVSLPVALTLLPPAYAANEVVATVGQQIIEHESAKDASRPWRNAVRKARRNIRSRPWAH